MTRKEKLEQNIQKIKADLRKGHYSLKRVSAKERNPLRVKRLKKLWKKIKVTEEGSTEDKMLLLFELGKELGNDYT